MSTELSTRQLFEHLQAKLQLEWTAGPEGGEQPLRGSSEAEGQALVGGLNWIHPNRIQVIGPSELAYLPGFLRQRTPLKLNMISLVRISSTTAPSTTSPT